MLNDNGSVSKKKFKLNLNAKVSNNNNPVLQNKDIIVVNSNNQSKISTGLGAATEPVATVVTVLILFKLLN